MVCLPCFLNLFQNLHVALLVSLLKLAFRVLIGEADCEFAVGVDRVDKDAQAVSKDQTGHVAKFVVRELLLNAGLL